MSANPITIQPSKELKEAINAALTPEALQAALSAESQRLGLKLADDAKAAEVQAVVDAAKKAETDKAVADKASADLAAGAQPFRREMNIAGKDFEFEAPTELELERMINNALMVAYAVQPSNQETDTVEETVDPAVAAKAAADATAAKAALEVKFRSGEISAAEYIEQSGAMADYLAAQGVPIESLRAAVNETEAAQSEKSWADATQEFLHSPAGADWPGGDKNLRVIGMQLLALGLEDAPDKVAALAQAYHAMKSAGTVFPGDNAATTTAVTATAAADAQAAAAKAAADKKIADDAAAVAAAEAARKAESERRTSAISSSFFGVSSGIGAGADAARAKAVNDLKAEIPKSATPEEILAAWKEKQIEAGVDPNAAFMTQFSARPR